jgi:hypothetical protein
VLAWRAAVFASEHLTKLMRLLAPASFPLLLLLLTAPAATAASRPQLWAKPPVGRALSHSCQVKQLTPLDGASDMIGLKVAVEYVVHIFYFRWRADVHVRVRTQKSTACGRSGLWGWRWPYPRGSQCWAELLPALAAGAVVRNA